MRICYVINNLAGGGAERLVKSYSEIFSRRGHDVTVIKLNKKGDVFSIDENSVKVIDLSENSKYSVSILLKLYRCVSMGRFDVIHVSLFPAFYYVGILSCFVSFNSIYHEHNSYNRRQGNLLLRFLDRFIIRRYKGVVAISDAVESVIVSQYKVRPEFVCRIYNGVSLGYSQVRERKVSEIIRVAMVASFTEQKDHITLIKSVAALLNVELYLFGSGDTRPKIEHLVRSLGLESRVFFKGFVSNIHRELESIDVAVLSSNWEGFGLSAVESMSMSIPTVVSNVNGLNEVVSIVELQFERGDSLTLARIIDRLHKDKNFYTEMQKRCYYLSRQFDIHKATDKMERYYEGIVCYK